jgi:hypothetical protein
MLKRFSSFFVIFELRNWRRGEGRRNLTRRQIWLERSKHDSMSYERYSIQVREHLSNNCTSAVCHACLFSSVVLTYVFTTPRWCILIVTSFQKRDSFSLPLSQTGSILVCWLLQLSKSLMFCTFTLVCCYMCLSSHLYTRTYGCQMKP